MTIGALVAAAAGIVATAATMIRLRWEAEDRRRRQEEELADQSAASRHQTPRERPGALGPADAPPAGPTTFAGILWRAIHPATQLDWRSVGRWAVVGLGVAISVFYGLMALGGVFLLVAGLIGPEKGLLLLGTIMLVLGILFGSFGWRILDSSDRSRRTGRL